jgi:hypothetical protein
MGKRRKKQSSIVSIADGLYAVQRPWFPHSV